MIIYKITNTINGKIYIGCTVLSLQKRLTSHYWKRNEGDTALKRALLKYGKDAFSIVEIDKAITREELFEKEKYWIRILDTMNPEIGYNLHEGGACLGRNATQSEKEMNRSRNMGKECKMETRVKISLAQKGKPRIITESMKIANSLKIGKKHSKEHIEKCRITRIGKKLSEETKQKIRIGNLGQKRSIEAKLNMSESAKNYSSKHKNKLGCNIYCPTNNKVYFSHKQASDILGIGRVGITRTVNGALQQTQGYKFQKLTAEHLIF